MLRSAKCAPAHIFVHAARAIISFAGIWMLTRDPEYKRLLENDMISNKLAASRKNGENAMKGPRNDEGNSARILARQLARPLTSEEIDFVAGGMRAAGAGGGTCSAGTCCTPDCDD